VEGQWEGYNVQLLAKQTFISEQKAIPRPKSYIKRVKKKIKKSFYIALFLFSSNYDVMNVSRVKKKNYDCKTNQTSK
jgi:hypothetical protein